MPKDPKRNIQSYQIEGGHLNEFDFQKSQGEMTQEAEAPLAGKNDKPKTTKAERVAEVTAKAHRTVVKRKKSRLANAAGVRPKHAGKRSEKKTARTPAKKSPSQAGSKKRAQATSKKPSANR